MVTESKRYHPTKFTRLVIYPLGFLVFFLALTIVIVMANGYSFFLKDGKFTIQKTGMIITNSRPSEANIYLDGKKFDKRTSFSFLPVKITNLLPGKHTLIIKKDGYRDWQNSVDVRANLVSWVNYVLLFPTDLKISEVDNLVGKNIIAESKNRRFLLVSGKEENIETLFAYDFSSGNLNKIWPKSFVPTEEWLKNPQIVTADFNQNNDKILLTLKNGDGQSLAILETANEGKIYALTSIPVAIDKIIWSANDANELYLLSKGTLYRTNTAKLNEVQELAKDVIDFSSERNRTIYFVTKTNEQVSLGQMAYDGGRRELISDSIKFDTSYKLSYSSQVDALGVLPKNDKTLTVFYRNNGKMASLELSKDIYNFKWSSDGRSIFYQNGRFIKNFNWDEEKETIATLSDKIVSVDWYFDEDHYLVQTEKEFFVIDYDNTNKVVFSDKPIQGFYSDPKYSSFIFNIKTSNYKYQSTF